ncbi:MAG: large repetitive protein [Verrucomicrobiota bacterium]
MACSLGLLLLFGGAARAFSYSLNGYKWPSGSQIGMHLGLNGPPVALQDGSASWDASAADALAIWNQYVDTVKFVQAPGGNPSGGDGANSVFFSNTIYGDSFGSTTLAVTVNYSNLGSGAFTETDVIFNNVRTWNSYRGPIWGSGAGATYDFHRVALHEFGHVLGLDHPDQHGQNVLALMNSIITDLDHLADDDIAGAKSIYGQPALNAFLGADFRYQVVANNNPSSYSASGLPPGLTIDSASGMISGVATISGSYSVVITASGSGGSMTLTIQIVVMAPSSNSNQGVMLKKLDISVGRLAVDRYRPRVYATVPASNSVVVVNTASLEVIKTIAIGSNPVGLSVSTDGSKLWVANSGSTTAAIGVIDLNTLQVLPSLPAPFFPYDVEEGLDHRLYVTSLSGTNASHGIMQIDALTGVVQGYVGSSIFDGYGLIEISPDRKTLYFGARYGYDVLRFDVSQPDAALVQRARIGGNAEDLKLSNNGNWVLYPSGGGNAGNTPYTTFKLSAADLTFVQGSFSTGPYPGAVAFSGDDLILYHGLQFQNEVAVFDAKTFALLSKIRITPTGVGYDVEDMVVDNTGGYLFVATSINPPQGDLRIFGTGRTNVAASAPQAAKSLLNVSTRLRVQPGQDALIGGFIIQGANSKVVVVRAIGPSLPVLGKLPNPTLEIHDSTGAVISSNDNWNSDRAHVLNSGLAPKDEYEAAIVVSLLPGSYTVIVRGVADSIGVALVELYDIDSNHSRMANLSTRGKVETGDNVMIGGFIIGGTQATNVAVRAIGPSLANYSITNPLLDPMLEVHNGNGALLAQDDDWRMYQEQALIDSGLAPTDNRESALLLSLQPGAYTPIVRGKDDSVGVGLVEVYNLDAK